jgi:hypothetical protein
MGSVDGPEDEKPRYKTTLPGFCLDQTEVTVEAYTACVAGSDCTLPNARRITCNYGRSARAKHPINCITFGQAEHYCKSQGKRLPSEVEWEFAAKGGSEERRYSWGSESPDGRTCWKQARSCDVQSYDPGAFGLYDMTGNVWEWTATAYSRYPWPPRESPTRVYRGGSWSRRFDRWMTTTLRNRFGPDREGSHLGFRCAGDASNQTCAYGKDSDGKCLHGVSELECPKNAPFNGARCAAPDDPKCREGHHQEPGLGCVSDVPVVLPNAPDRSAEVKRSRTPKFDGDCQTYHPERPHAYQLSGGDHVSRNTVGARGGCKNRDVGVGWNSACCP